MADFQLTWGIFTGVISIVTVIPACLLYIHSQLPSQKLRPMFESLKEADELLLTCVEEGLVYGTNADLYRSALNLLHTRAEGARFEAHAARTYAEDVANWFKGLSRRISEICWQVRDVRADISSNSLRERERRASLREGTTTETASDVRVVDDPNLGSFITFVSSLGPVPGDTAESSIQPSGVKHPHDLTIVPVDALSKSGSDETTTTTSCYLAAKSSGEVAAKLEEIPRLSISSTSIAESPRKTTHNDRRASVSSESSRASSGQSMHRKKRGGDPLSRARTMARFARQARATRPPVFIVDPRHLAAFEFVESDDDGDDGWVDEQAIRIVA